MKNFDEVDKKIIQWMKKQSAKHLQKMMQKQSDKHLKNILQKQKNFVEEDLDIYGEELKKGEK